MASYDILCFGAICADLRLRLPRFPQPGQGMRALAAAWMPGGNALLEAQALVGWGARVALMGDALGQDEPGVLVANALARLGLDGLMRRDPAAATVVCHVLITPDGQRTILVLRPADHSVALPDERLLRACRVVSVTRYGPRTSEAAALACAAGCTLVVGDATHPADELALVADVIVTSAELLAQHNPGSSIEQQMADLHALRGATVLVSDGPRAARALWREQNTPRTATVCPPACTPRDTTGAGDIFRAGVSYGVLRAWPWPETLTFACAQASAAVGG